MRLILVGRARALGKITYDDLQGQLVERFPELADRKAFNDLLLELSLYEHDEGRGVIAALVVDPVTLRPGPHYYAEILRKAKVGFQYSPVAAWLEHLNFVHHYWLDPVSMEGEDEPVDSEVAT